MATAELTLHATEGSTYAIPVAFKDEDGSAVTPDSIEWTLTDEASNIINARDGVEVTPPASSINIVLTGADLPAPEKIGCLFLTLNWVYDSTYGSDLPGVAQIKILVDGLEP